MTAAAMTNPYRHCAGMRCNVVSRQCLCECDACSDFDAYAEGHAAGAAEVAALRDLLRRLEWCGYDPDGPCCVICNALGDGRTATKHEDSCELAAALKAAATTTEDGK